MNPLTNPWVLLGIVLTLIGSHLAVGLWQRHDGALAATNACLEDKAAAVKAANDDRDKHIANEHRLETQLAETGVNHAEEIKQIEDQRDSDVRAAHSRGIRLRAPGACVASGEPAAGSPARAGERDGGASCELSPATSADLLILADDADRNTKQLAAAQQVIRSFEKTCHP